MKPKKTLKSLTELTAESIGAVDAEADKAKTDPQVLTEALLIPIDNFPQVQNAQRFRDWGINE
jgi:hypothetical protein